VTGSGGVVRLPPHAPGMRVGLYGGSFNPPHAGHRHVSLMALRRLGLDRIWWMVTPGNPLKDRRRLPALAARLAAARIVAHHPRIDVTGFEAEIGAAYSIDTVRFLVRRCPALRFVWIMGADSLATFQRWKDWQGIAAAMPMAVIDRPGWTLAATASRAAIALRERRMAEAEARRLADSRPPAWVYLHGARSSLSSTQLRLLQEGR
jgi:nicotinate-nucleotide adenylyltransferase